MKVLNFRSLNIDYTYSVDHFVEGGETLSSRKLQVFSGGKGLNQSIALSKSGAEVWHAGAVGQSEGEFLLEELKKAGVHTELVARLEEKTPLSRETRREETASFCTEAPTSRSHRSWWIR